MRITVTHDFWGNCWLVKANDVIVADSPERYVAVQHARALHGVMLNAGVKDVTVEHPVDRENA